MPNTISHVSFDSSPYKAKQPTPLLEINFLMFIECCGMCRRLFHRDGLGKEALSLLHSVAGWRWETTQSSSSSLAMSSS